MSELFKETVIKALLGKDATKDGNPKRGTVKLYLPTRPLLTEEEYVEYATLNADACKAVGLEWDAGKYQNDGFVSNVRNKMNVKLRKAFGKKAEEDTTAVAEESADVEF